MATQNRNSHVLEGLALGLGWFSVGLGLAELLAPRRMSRLVGTDADPAVLRILGLREIASGIGILSRRQQSAWVQSRVAGDIIDLALLGTAIFSPKSDRSRLMSTTAALAAVAALDVLCSDRLKKRQIAEHGGVTGIEVSRVITINSTAEDLYGRWRRFEELPRIMSHLESVQQTSDRTWHWVAKGPAGLKSEWDAELMIDRANEVIAWKSLPGSSVETSGNVSFKPATGNRGTVLRVDLQYRPPGGKLGAALAWVFGESPGKQLAVDLLRFKQWVETGEIARTEGQPAGRGRSTSLKYDEVLQA